jgi:hypothetical protein
MPETIVFQKNVFFQHFFTTTNPLNLFATPAQLQAAKEGIQP